MSKKVNVPCDVCAHNVVCSRREAVESVAKSIGRISVEGNDSTNNRVHDCAWIDVSVKCETFLQSVEVQNG